MGHGKHAASASDSSSTRARRDRNRRAQHVFRIRKQAEQLEKDRHIQNLETEIEQIGSAFRDLVDAVLQSEYARLDENLMRKLWATARRVVLLANDKAEGSLDTARPEEPKEPTLAESIENSNATGAVPSIADTSVLGAHVHDRHAYDDSNTLGADIGGLPSRVQLDGTNGRLSNIIIQATLRYGYTILLGQLDALNESLKQTFRSTLRYFSREQALFNIEWLLGPGNWFLPKLASTDFTNPGAEDAIKDLSARKSRQALNPGADPNRRTEIILNANEIEDYIMSRMVGYVDEDVIELVAGNESGLGPEPQAESLPSRDFIDCDIFFPVERQQTRKASLSSPSQRQHTIRISQSRLLENIVYISVCTAGGPGFRTDALEMVIALSAIDPLGDPSLLALSNDATSQAIVHSLS
ncbi:hypothetical protein DL771_006988 [Monosporascus sp. 5C6A]|nr:hypothetical protein DL771_006988 [Monosporascus sp. 5C6A]